MLPNMDSITHAILKDICTRRQEMDGQIFWYRLIEDTRGYGQIGVTDWSVYNGAGGILLALLELQTEDTEVISLRAELISKFIADYSHEMLSTVNWPIGAFMGLGGALYIAAKIYQTTHDHKDELDKIASSLLRLIESAVEGDVAYDIMEGAAGAILCIDAAQTANLLGNEGDCVILKLVEHLLKSVVTDVNGNIGWLPGPTKYVLGGLAHGYAGVALAASRVSGKLPMQAGQLQEIAVTNQLLQFDRYNSRFLDLRKADPWLNPEMEAWCHGAEGILLSLIDDQSNWGLDLETIRGITARICDAPPNLGKNLCHGLAGRIVVLEKMLDFYTTAPSRSNAQAIDQLVQAIKSKRNELTDWITGPEWDTEFEDPCLMLGMAGIALAIGNPRAAASLLVLR